MIPSLYKPKYKSLVKIRTDVWNTLRYKTIKRKKWRILIFSVKRKKRFKRKHVLTNYQTRSVSKFPTYRRYRYQKDLILRKHMRIVYGKLQDFKIKSNCLIVKKNSSLGFLQHIEQKAVTFLYRAKLINTYSEGRLHHKHKRIIINGNYKATNIRKGDVLHFTPNYEKLLIHRFLTNKKRFGHYYYGIHTCVDFDVNSIRFFFRDNLKYFRNHPFRLPFERVMHWYTRV